MKFKTLLLILFGISIMQIQSQTSSLELKKWDGTDKSIELNTLRKITFSGSNLILNYQTGSTESIVTSDIRKFTFGSFTGVDEILASNELCIFPNPSSDYIILKNVSEGELNISIYSINGTLIMNANLSDVNQQIDVRQLTKGIYLIKTNAKVLKFIKL